MTIAQERSIKNRALKEVYALRIAKLVKLLDLGDAKLLIFVYSVYPRELIKDLKGIEFALGNNKIFSITEVLAWYERRHFYEVTGIRYPLPKPRLGSL